MAYNPTTNTIDTANVQAGQNVSPANNPAFQSGGTEVAPIVPGQNIGTQNLGANTTGSPIGTMSNTPTSTGALNQDQLNALAKQSGFNGNAFSAVGLSPNVNNNQQIGDTMKAGLQSVSGKSVPATPGDGMSAVNDATKQINQDLQNQQANTQSVTAVTNALKADAGYQQLINDHNAQLQSQTQQPSLEQEYTKLSSDLGLPALNTQLMDMKNVIDGTEDDIRAEITKSGGFATNSQVLAMTAARNKVVIQNYNNLLQTRNNAVDQINTMIGLSEKDRTIAQQQANDQLNFDSQIIGYQQKFQQNSQNALQTMVSTEGWDGIYKAALASGDPTAIQRINQIMGPGFDLTSVAQASAAAREQVQIKAQQDATKFVSDQAQAKANLNKTNADIANTQANTKKTNQEISDAGGNPNPAKAEQPGYNAQGVKYTTASAATEIKAAIKANGQTGTRNLLDPNTYNYYKSWWVQNGLTDASFDSVFGGMKDPSLATKKVYN